MAKTRKNIQKQITAALAVRMYIGELPYVKMFLNHYRRLSFSKIYIIITNSSEVDIIKNYLLDYASLTEFIISDANSIDMKSLNLLLKKQVVEDYLLFIDVDEFLDISPHKSIMSFLKTEPGEKYHFFWRITVSDGYSEQNRGFDAHFSKKPHKTMCKTSIIKGWEDSHNCLTSIPVTTIKCKQPLVHFYGRGFNDILIKCIFGKNYRNKQKTSTLSDIIESSTSKSVNDLPNRLKMLAVISRTPKPIKINKIPLTIDYNIEEKLVNLIGSKKRDDLFRKYTHFREALDLDKHISLYLKRGLSGVKWSDLNV